MPGAAVYFGALYVIEKLRSRRCGYGRIRSACNALRWQYDGHWM